jgi:excisionase family DNA binding protein
MTEKQKCADNKDWYSIPEAAEYLGISKPTIFRWMKSGLLSYYKVGGSTRFSREGLDAVIEKNTGQREAEKAAGACACCGNDFLAPGTLQGTGRLYFRPEHSKFWSLEEALVPIVARVCTACGYVQMHADTEKLVRLLPKTEEDK